MFYNVSYTENVGLRDPFRPADGRITPVSLVLRTLRDLRPLTFGLAEAVTSSNVYWHRQLDWTEPWLPKLVPTAIIRCCQLFLAILILLGLIRFFVLEPAIAFYLGLSLLAIAAAPWPAQYIRYLSPLAAYLAIALLLGLAMVARRTSPGRSARLTGIVIGLIVVHQATSLFLCYRQDHSSVTEVTGSGSPVRFRLFYYGEGHRLLDAAQEWIAERAGPADVIAAGMPHWLFLRSGRKAVMVPFGADPSAAARLLANVPVRYLVLDDIDDLSLTSFVAPAIEHSPEWQQVFTPGRRCRVFERTGPGSLPH